ncbi:sigma-70 family RNA polymerase sigma factor [Salinactinospora qingdaonensis]|uniref:RNA polymerase sigma factor n=1 Tax=Salinactinospora qingdaonensis TaxID=702744 RepID=A0ABP7FW08_9ACTN
MDEAELTQLAMAARDGDVSALERLIEETRRDVMRFIAAMADPRWAEELTQETFMRALRGLPRFAGRSSVRSWLLAIARHTVADRYRERSARPQTSGVAEWDAVQSHLPRPTERFDERVALLDLLAGLSKERRTAFVLTQLEGFSYIEVARMFSLPVGTVRSRVARAREDLVRALRAAESTAATESPTITATS